MITAQTIAGGQTYLAKHLSANDYYAEGEKVEGEWTGLAAKALGLEGAVEAEAFEALRTNRHPSTGARLTARDRASAKVRDRRTGKLVERKQTAFHDITFCAPKAASIVAIVGGDERIVRAWQQAVREATTEMERFAAVRLRSGEFANSEKLRVTGNVAGALFFHDASRALDPQLHAHWVVANASYDAERGGWFALQRLAMMEASPYVRAFLHHDFARRLRALGYRVEDAGKEGFTIAGIGPEAQHALSQRTLQRLAFERRYERTFGHRPSKRRVEQFVKDNRGAAEARYRAEFRNAFGRAPTSGEVEAFVRDWREPKLREIATADVRQLQRDRLAKDALTEIETTVAQARERAAHGIEPIQATSDKTLRAAAAKGLEHCLERHSVARLGDVLEAALRFSGRDYGEFDPRGLHAAAKATSGAITDGYQITTEAVLAEESRLLLFAARSRGRFEPLGDAARADLSSLDGEQREAVIALSESGNGIAVLIGDAGTGKTRALGCLDAAYRLQSGRGMVALAPTTRATAELRDSGYPVAATVAAFLNSERQQEGAAGRAVLVDEAGFLSSRQLAELVRVAEERGARLVLVGDTKQHESVERGSALRGLIDSGLVQPVRLSTVRRQRREPHRQVAKLLAQGQSLKALERADALGMVEQIPDSFELFERAAAHYADALEAGQQTLVVIPTWEDIEQFNGRARAELKTRGLIHGPELEITGTASLSWTEVERTHWRGYRPGLVLNFHRAGAGMKAGESATVADVFDDGVLVQRPDGGFAMVRRKQRGTFDVAEARKIAVAAGDELLFRANCPAIGVANGERLRVEAVDPERGSVTLAGGKVLPAGFTQVCHGHAVTSHKSQGASVERSLLVVGPGSLGATNLRQFYVSNTRFKEGHRLFVHDLAKLKAAVAERSERPLAREFVAGLGKELRVLLAEAEAAKAVPGGDAAAEQRDARIKSLLREVARQERHARTAAQFKALWSGLGGRLLPKRVRRWLTGRRAQRSRKPSAQTYALARGIRAGHRAGIWLRRAGRGMRSAGRRH